MVLNANDYCSIDDDCVDDMTCNNTRCKGYPVGAECTPPMYPGVRPAWFGLTHYVCGGGLVCAPDSEKKETKYHCVYGGNISDVCNKTNPCKTGLICNFGKCIRPFSLKVGQKCDHDQACTCINGTCVQSTKYSHVLCDRDDDCGEGTNGVCGACNHLTGERFCGLGLTIDLCTEQWYEAYECYERKKCAPTPGASVSLCVQEQCTAETNDLLSCSMHCEYYRGELLDCAANLILRNCPKFPMWARIITAFTVLSVAVLVVFTIYGISLLTTKKKYKYLSS